MTEAEIAWVAGVLEGEGSFLVQRREGGCRISVRCGMTDHDVVERLAAVTGVGRVFGPYASESNGGRKPTKTWVVVKRADVVALIVRLHPWMGERRGARISEMLAAHEEAPLRSWAHGKSSSYKRHGCRCEECCEAFRAEQRRLYAQRVAQGLPGRGSVEYAERRRGKARAKHAARKHAAGRVG